MYTRCVRVCVCVCVCERVCICVCVCACSECTDMYIYMFSRDLSLSLCACVCKRGGHLPAVFVYLDTYAYTCESVNRFRHTGRQTDGQTDRQTDRILLSLLLFLLLLFITSLSLPALGSAGAGGGGESLSLCTAGRVRPGTTWRRSVLGFVRCDRKFPKKNSQKSVS